MIIDLSVLLSIRFYKSNHVDCLVELPILGSKFYAQGIEKLAARNKRLAGQLRIIWAARWEHDKNPEDFFKALEQSHL